MHVAPSEGKPRDVAGPVIDMLFPPGTPARVPIAAITGTNGKTTTARMLAHIPKMAGYTPGLTTTDGVYIDGQRTVRGRHDRAGVRADGAARSADRHRGARDRARRPAARRHGLPRRATSARCSTCSPTTSASKGIDTLEQLAEVKRDRGRGRDATARCSTPTIRCVLKMAGYTEAKRICYVTMNPQHALVREHIRAGGRACALEAGVNGHMITLYDTGSHIPLLWTHLIPATLEGRALHNVQNAMFAAAMAFSLGIKLDAIRQGLRTFDTHVLPGAGPHERVRRASVQGAPRLRPQRARGRRRWPTWRSGSMSPAGASCVLAGARRSPRRGPARDRRCGRRQASTITSAAATTTCAAATATRCRASWRSGAARGRACRASAISIIPDEQEAIDAALRWASPGDLLLVFADALTRSWKQIIKFQPEGDAPQAGRTGRGRRCRSRRCDEALYAVMEGVVRDERGLRFEREAND